MQFLFGFLLSAISLFLILIILVQRGRGGGLTGALGGMGGQSAFGTKAGDTFTKITVVVAAAWILVSILSVKILGVGVGGGPLGDASAAAQSLTPSATTGDAGTSVLDDLPAAGAADSSSDTSDASGDNSGSSLESAEAEPSGE